MWTCSVSTRAISQQSQKFARFDLRKKRHLAVDVGTIWWSPGRQARNTVVYISFTSCTVWILCVEAVDNFISAVKYLRSSKMMLIVLLPCTLRARMFCYIQEIGYVTRSILTRGLLSVGIDCYWYVYHRQNRCFALHSYETNKPKDSFIPQWGSWNPLLADSKERSRRSLIPT